jgi:hypothetical protein
MPDEEHVAGGVVEDEASRVAHRGGAEARPALVALARLDDDEARVVTACALEDGLLGRTSQELEPRVEKSFLGFLPGFLQGRHPGRPFRLIERAGSPGWPRRLRMGRRGRTRAARPSVRRRTVKESLERVARAGVDDMHEDELVSLTHDLDHAADERAATPDPDGTEDLHRRPRLPFRSAAR